MPFIGSKIRPLVVAYIRNNRKILVVRGYDSIKKEIFYRLPGGGIEFGETAEEALIREFHEEFGIDVKIERRLDVFENIFNYEDQKGHEIVFIYEASLTHENLYKEDGIKFIEGGHMDIEAKWVDPCEKIIIYPERIKEINL